MHTLQVPTHIWAVLLQAGQPYPKHPNHVLQVAATLNKAGHHRKNGQPTAVT